MDRMKMLASEKDPVATWEMIDKEIGDVVDQRSQLRNPQQVWNAQWQLNSTHGKHGSHLT